MFGSEDLGIFFCEFSEYVQGTIFDKYVELIFMILW